MSEKTHLNVKYDGNPTQIDLKNINKSLISLRKAIKADFRQRLAMYDAPELKLYRQGAGGSEELTKWSQIQELDPKYSDEDTDFYLEIRTSPPSSRQASQTEVAILQSSALNIDGSHKSSVSLAMKSTNSEFVKDLRKTSPYDRRSILSDAFPPLGERVTSCSVSRTRLESAYNIEIRKHDGIFGTINCFCRDMLNKQSRSMLWAEAEEEGKLDRWSGETDIQTFVKYALRDCLKTSRLDSDISIQRETTFSISRIMAKHGDRADVTTLVTGTNVITGVCEVKLPGFNLDSISQIVDYMVDLRNSFNVRFVFGILTTYEKWRILWFADTNHAAEETNLDKFMELCQAGTANDYSIANKLDVYLSRVYDRSELELVEVLVNLLYKIGKSPISTPQKFIEPHKKYIHAKENSFTYQSLPVALNSFSYKMPSAHCKNFYILQYYHRGGDGRIALCCSSAGDLCVLKFLLYRENEKQVLENEAKEWNQLWNSKCRVVMICKRHALLMPFCFHIRMRFGNPIFFGLKDWNRLDTLSGPSFIDTEVKDFPKLDKEKFEYYQHNPKKAADQAITRMLELNVVHSDFKWEHVALLPSFSNTSDLIDLLPISLDLTRITVKLSLNIPNEKTLLLSQLS